MNLATGPSAPDSAARVAKKPAVASVFTATYPRPAPQHVGGDWSADELRRERDALHARIGGRHYGLTRAADNFLRRDR